MKKALLLPLLLMSIISWSQIPAAKQKKSILIKDGIAHIGNGKVINHSAIGFKEGKIVLVADLLTTTIDTSLYDHVISAKGKHLYPGLIAPNSSLGLREIDAVRATVDDGEVGKFNPHVRSITAFNTDSKIIPTVRNNGVLISQATPKKGVFSGASSIMELDGWNWEDAALKVDDGIHLNWPSRYRKTGSWPNYGPEKKSTVYHQHVQEIQSLIKDAKAYANKDVHQEINIRFEALKGIFDGSKRLYVHVHNMKSMIEIINLKKSTHIAKVVFVGGYDSWMITSLLKENNIPVIIENPHSVPKHPGDDIDLPYKLAFLLQKDGVLFCIQSRQEMGPMSTRNLPFLAGTTAIYGLGKEDALSAITLNTAKILGVDKRIGSIENGKDATFFISSGDALDMRTNQVETAFIRGKVIDLDNHQKRLNKKFIEKYSTSN